MRRRSAVLLAIAAAASLMLAACTPAAPAPTAVPTKAPAAPAPTKAPEPTKPAAQPTAQPAAQPTAVPKSSFPEKGKTITIIVPYEPGGPTDVMSRLALPRLERELGVPVQVVNKPGASSQVGVTEMVKSKPDGYTIGMWNVPTILTVYLDPERKPAFGRKDLQPLAIMVQEPAFFAVKKDSPIQTLKDLVDRAKAEPGKLTYGTAGYLAINHQTAMKFERLAGVKMAAVHFNGTAPLATGLLGEGNLDFASTGITPPMMNAYKNDQIRVLALADKKESPKLPGVKTFESLGYPLYMFNSYTFGLPAGVPKDVLDTLAAAFKKTSEDAEYRQKMEDTGMTPIFIGPAEYAKFWDDMEPEVKQMMDQAKAEVVKK